MMKQWEGMKAQYPDTILLFRMGDFYEMFRDDAVTAARELELTLTAREKNVNAIPMCGVPFHAGERYIAQLVAKGYRVAICEQTEDPKYARGLVKREVVRVLSPGTVLEDSFLNSVGAAKGNNYLAALCANAELSRFGLALLDISTGEFLAGEIRGGQQVAGNSEQGKLCEPVATNTADEDTRWASLREELLRFAPAEVLVPQRLRECAGFLDAMESLQLMTTAFDSFGFDEPRQKLLTQFHTSSLRGFGLEELPLAIEAAALALDYLKSTQLGALGHVRRELINKFAPADQVRARLTWLALRPLSLTSEHRRSLHRTRCTSTSTRPQHPSSA